MAHSESTDSYVHVCERCGSSLTVPARYYGRDLKCHQCGHPFHAVHPEAKKSASAPSSPQATSAAPTKNPSSASLGLFAALIPFGGAFIAWFWVGNMNLLQGPMASLGLVGALTVLSTAGLCAVEAQQLGFGAQEGETGPAGWFIGIAGLWIIGLPWYLRARRSKGADDLLWLGIFGVLVFAGVSGLLAFATAHQQQSLLKLLE